MLLTKTPRTCDFYFFSLFSPPIQTCETSSVRSASSPASSGDDGGGSGGGSVSSPPLPGSASADRLVILSSSLSPSPPSSSSSSKKSHLCPRHSRIPMPPPPPPMPFPFRVAKALDPVRLTSVRLRMKIGLSDEPGKSIPAPVGINSGLGK